MQVHAYAGISGVTSCVIGKLRRLIGQLYSCIYPSTHLYLPLISRTLATFTLATYISIGSIPFHKLYRLELWHPPLCRFRNGSSQLGMLRARAGALQ